MEKKYPEKIGKFKIIETIGKGGMGDVFKALQEPLNREVALKILPEEFSRNDEFLKRFMTEATAISHLEHQNIVGIYDYGTDGKVHYIAMRYVEGLNLAEKLKKCKVFDVGVALEYTKQICRALKYAHERDIIHRDIKPQNILLNKENQLFVTDFGIAKFYSNTGLTRTGVVVGTPEYMSPEQAEGVNLNPQTDIYSLGIVLYEMLTGNPPFTGENPLSIAYKHVNVPPPPVSEKRRDISQRLELIILKTLKKDRRSRYKNIDEFLNDLDKLENSFPDADKTRDMAMVTGLKKEKLFDDEQRIVDRRSDERRLEGRRSYLRREDGNHLFSKKFLFVLVLLIIAGSYIGYNKFKESSILPSLHTINKLVGSGFPEKAFDDNAETCWVGSGKNPNFSVTLARKKEVNRVDFLSGNNSTENSFFAFARPKRITLILNKTLHMEIILDDIRERQVFFIPEIVSLKNIKLEVNEFYKGRVSNDICITEVKFWNSPM